MTKKVLDNALLLQAIAGNDNIDDRSYAAPWPQSIPRYYDILKIINQAKNLYGIKIGIIKESLEVAVFDPQVRQCFDRAVRGLRKAGADVSEISIPLHAKGCTIWTGVSKVGGYLTKMHGAPGRRGHVMGDLNGLMLDALHTESKWDKAYVATKNVYLNGAYAESKCPTLLAKATNLSRQLRDAYDAALADHEVLIRPTLPYVATSHCSPDAGPLDQIKGRSV